MITFNADEVFQMAEQIERNGAKFYRKAADGAAGGADQLRKLAEMEEQHELLFAEMRAQLRPQMPITFDPDGLGPAYLRAMAAGKVFDATADPSAALTGNETIEAILRTAIGLERDSIIFYLGMKETMGGHGAGEKIDQIIQEEMTHITTLSNALAAGGL